MEVNTGAMARGYRPIPYPAPALLRTLRELGGRVILTSDCHDAARLIYGYAEALAEPAAWQLPGYETPPAA